MKIGIIAVRSHLNRILEKDCCELKRWKPVRVIA